MLYSQWRGRLPAQADPDHSHIERTSKDHFCLVNRRRVEVANFLFVCFQEYPFEIFNDRFLQTNTFFAWSLDKS